MVRGFAVSAVVTLLLSSSAVAVVNQEQGFLLDNQNHIAIAGGGSALNTNGLLVSQSQLARDPVHHVTTYQGGAAALNQSAGAFPVVGVLGANQSGLAAGAQLQSQPNGWTLGTQIQDLDALLMQDIFGEGSGLALALQNFVGIQTQVTFTMYGASANFQTVGVGQWDVLGGSGPVNTVISGGMDIGVDQNTTP